MKLISFISLFFICSIALGQELWLRHYGSTANDEILSLQHEGNELYSGGYFSGLISFNQQFLNTTGLNDCIVFKGDFLATAEWVTTFGGAYNDRVTEIALGSNASIAVCGFFNSSANFGPYTLNASNQSQDGFVGLLDSNGNFEWAIPIGGTEHDLTNSVSIDSEGNVVATGFFKGTMTLFGQSYSSTINPETEEYSSDAYVIKLSPNGTLIWFKHGIGPAEDNGLSIAVDNDDNIYCSFQAELEFSLNNLYPSNVDFSGLILKFDQAGNTLWHLRFSGFQTVIHDLIIDSDNNLISCGDYTGILAIDGVDQIDISSSLDYKALVLKCSSSGQIAWVNLEESENLISANQLCLDSQNNVYVAGTFRCQFTSLSEIYGEAIFYSLGYRDIYLSKIIKSTGNRDWSRNIASAKDDFPGGIQCKSEDLVYLAGSFSGHLLAPESENYWIENLWSPISPGFSVVYAGHPFFLEAFFCEEWNYYHYHTVSSYGNKDMFIGLCVDLYRQPLDWILHPPESECIKDLTYPEFQIEGTLNACGSGNILVNTHNTQNGYLSPDYQLSVNGNTLNSLNLSTQIEGMYYLEYTRLDGCYTATDSLELNINPIPQAPHITDSEGVNYQQVNQDMEIVIACVGDTVILTGGNINENQVVWSPVSDEQYLNDSTIFVTSNGTYQISVFNEFNCFKSTLVTVNFLLDLPEFYATPELFLSDGSEIHDGDTIRVCKYETINTILLNTETNPPSIIGGGFTLMDVTGTSNSVEGTTSFNNHIAELYYEESTHSTIDIQYNPSNPNNCEVGPFTATLSYSVYIEVIDYSPPFPYEDELLLCPGASIDLDLSFATDTILWEGVGILGPNNQEQVSIVLPGEYTVTYWVSLDECFFQNDVSFNVILKEDFIINPSINPPVICPDQELTLTANDALSYSWIGPLGISIGNEQSIVVTEPGPYYCLVEDLDFCDLQSEIIEVYEYFQPYIDETLTTNLCANDDVLIQITAAPDTDIQWQSPLSGSNTEQLITSPGTYIVNLESCGIETSLNFEIVDELPLAEISILGDGPFCPGDTAILQSSSDFSQSLWSTGEENTNEIIVSESGSYGLIIVDEFGCTSLEANVDVFIQIPEVPSIEDQILCLGEDITLTPFSEWEIFWYSSESLEELLSNSNEYLLEDVLSPQSLFLTGGSSDCQSLPIEVMIAIDPASIIPTPLELNPFYCSQTDLTIDPGTGLNYTWIFPDQSEEIGSSLFIEELSPNYSGEYLFFAFNENCSSPAQVFDLFIPDIQNVSIEPTGNQWICEGDSLLITASSVNPEIHWIPEFSGIDSIYAHNPGEYIAYVEDEYECQYFSEPAILDFIEVGFFAEPNQTVCLGESVELIIQDNAIANWYNDSYNLLSTSNELIVGPMQESTLIYCSQISSEGCIGDTVAIDIYVPFENGIASITGDEAACAGENASFGINESADDYVWITPSGEELLGNPIELVAVNSIDEGEYSVILSIENCEAVSEIHPFTIYDVPQKLLEAYPSCESEQVVLNSENELVLNWSTGESSEFITVTTPGWYYSDFTTENNCLARDSIFISHTNCTEVFPNIFSPNNDGFNDQIVFSTFRFGIDRVLIFNRWGAKVLELTTPPFIWNGDGLSEGTYFYLVEGVGENGVRKRISSSCMLVR